MLRPRHELRAREVEAARVTFPSQDWIEKLKRESNIENMEKTISNSSFASRVQGTLKLNNFSAKRGSFDEPQKP